MEKGCIIFSDGDFQPLYNNLEETQIVLLKSWLKSRKRTDSHYYLDTVDLRALCARFDIDFDCLSISEKSNTKVEHELISEIAPKYRGEPLKGYYATNKWLKKWSRTPLTN